MRIRQALPQDSAEIASIYAHYVAFTPFTFDTEPVSEEGFAERISSSFTAHVFLVLEHQQKVMGYAFSSPYKAKKAYQWIAEVGIYLHQDARSKGFGKALYSSLLQVAAKQNYSSLLAGITTPNPDSERLHAHFGFEPCFTLDNIGFKSGQWRQVIWWRKDLIPFDQVPLPIRSLDSFSPEELSDCGLTVS